MTRKNWHQRKGVVRKLWFEVWSKRASRIGDRMYPGRFRDRAKAEELVAGLRKQDGVMEAWIVEVWRL